MSSRTLYIRQQTIHLAGEEVEVDDVGHVRLHVGRVPDHDALGQPDGDGSSGRHRDLEPMRLLKAMSTARWKAGCARFLTLIHSRHRPER